MPFIWDGFFIEKYRWLRGRNCLTRSDSLYWYSWDNADTLINVKIQTENLSPAISKKNNNNNNTMPQIKKIPFYFKPTQYLSTKKRFTQKIGLVLHLIMFLFSYKIISKFIFFTITTSQFV